VFGRVNLAFAPLASLPSPDRSVWHLGPVPLRAYALCIVAGIIVACVVTDRRLRARGAPPWSILDIAIWAVPFGIIGARIYHVISSPAAYFGTNGDVGKAFLIWEGGLGIWGGVAGGALGAWLGCRQLRLPFTVVADSIAVGLPLAQAVGRLGNWFNNELYGGRADDLPWGLQVHQMSDKLPGEAAKGPDGESILLPGLYHPTFLYELLWCLGVAGLVYLLDRRFKFGKGRAFALYVMAYTVGRLWIEMMRTDPAETFLGQRINVWTSLLVFLGAAVYFVLRRGAAQEFVLPLPEGERGFRSVGEAEYLAAKDGVAAESADADSTNADSGDAQSTDDAGRDDPADDSAGEPAETSSADRSSSQD
jgi:prolipoprotein diacylglyceryl transferase